MMEWKGLLNAGKRYGLIGNGRIQILLWVFIFLTCLGSLQIARAQVYQSTDIPVDTLDQDTVISEIIVPDSFSIEDISVSLSLNHPFDGSLTLVLVSPDGTRVTLADQVGNDGDNFTGTIFFDGARKRIANGTAPFSEFFKPEKSLSTLTGKEAQGNWTLEVTDSIAGDQGQLTGWELNFTPLKYQSADVPVGIIDNTTVTSEIILPEGFTIGSVNVSLSLTHTYDSDLAIVLVGPDNTRINLATGVGSSGNDFTGTLFDDSASTPITSGYPPFTGSFQPIESLSALSGKDAQGSWILEITDRAGGDQGQLLSWGLNFSLKPVQNGPAFVSDDIPVNIIDITTVTSELEISKEFTVADISVSLSLNHPFDGSLTLVLVSPDGTRVTLADQVGNDGDNFTGTTFYDFALSGIGSGTPPFSGFFQPAEPLSAFMGKDAQGIWTLEIADSTAGEEGQLMEWSVNFSPLEYQSDVRADIPDASSVFSQIEVPEGFTIGSVNVSLSLTHTYDSDLTIVLVAPDNTQITLAHGNGGAGNNFTETIFNDAVENSIDSGDVPFTGSFRPVEPLSVLSGKEAMGTWSLEIIDCCGSDQGELISWELDFSLEPAQDPGNQDGPVYTSAGVPAEIVDNGTVTSGLVVQNDFTIETINVFFDIDHLKSSDLTIVLVAPDGTRITLVDGVGPDLLFKDTVFTNQSSMSIDNATLSFTGYFQPESPLSVLQGKHASGIWSLEITDNVEDSNGSGALNSWSLDFSPVQQTGILDPSKMTRYTSLDAPKDILDSTSSRSELIIPHDREISDIRVAVSLNHPSNKDLSLVLIAPDGTRTTLLWAGHINGNSLLGTIFNDDAQLDIGASEAKAPYTGFFRPTNPLSGLKGTNAQGTWFLEIADSGSTQQGQLVSWGLDISSPGMDGTIGIKSPAPGCPLQIADGSISMFELPILKGYPVSDLNIMLSLNHPANSELIVALIAPDGTRILLADQLSGSNLKNMVFNDEAFQVVLNGNAPYIGSFAPVQPLSVLYGKDITGTWKLEITDTVLENTGALVSWGLVFTPLEEPLNYDAYDSTVVPVNIIDYTTVTSQLSLPAGTPFADIKVAVKISHTYNADLIIALVAPDGTRITLADRPGEGDSYLIDLIFDDAAADSILNSYGPFTGPYRPKEPLSTLAGKDPSGTWTLEITDNGGGDQGQLLAWGLLLSTQEKQDLPGDLDGDSDIDGFDLHLFIQDLNPGLESSSSFETFTRWFGLTDLNAFLSDNGPALRLLAATGTDSVAMAWTPGRDGITPPEQVQYEIHMDKNEGFIPRLSTLKQISAGSGNAEITGLEADTIYFVKIVAIFRDGVNTVTAPREIRTHSFTALQDDAVTVVLASDLGLGPHITDDGILYTFPGEIAPPTGSFLFSQDSHGDMTLRLVDVTSAAGGMVDAATSNAGLTDILDRGAVYTEFELFNVEEKARFFVLDGIGCPVSAQFQVAENGTIHSSVKWDNHFFSARQTTFAQDDPFLTLEPRETGSIVMIKDSGSSVFEADIAAEFDPEMVVAAKWGSLSGKELEDATVSVKGTLNLKMAAQVNFSAQADLDQTIQLWKRTWTSLYTLSGSVPLFQEITLSMGVKASILTPGKISTGMETELSEIVEIGAAYDGTSWVPYISSETSPEFLSATLNVKGGAEIQIRLIPRIDVRFYGIDGTSLTVEPVVKSFLSEGQTTDHAGFLAEHPEHADQQTGFDASLGVATTVEAGFSGLGTDWDELPSTCVSGPDICLNPNSDIDLFSMSEFDIEFQADANKVDLFLEVTTGLNNPFDPSSVQWDVYPKNTAIEDAACYEFNNSDGQDTFICTASVTPSPGVRDFTVFGSGHGTLGDPGRQFRQMDVSLPKIGRTLLDFSADPVQPLQIATLTLDDISNLSVEQSYVKFNNAIVPIHEINQPEKTLKIAIPLVNGNTAVSVFDGIGGVSTTLNIVVNPSPLPEGETIESVKIKLSNSLGYYINEILNNSTSSDYSEEQQEAFDQSVSELDILNEAIQFFINEILTESELLELAAFLENFVFENTSDTTMTLQKDLSAKGIVTSDWDAIMQRRSALKASGFLDSITDFSVNGQFGGVGGVIASATPGLSTIMSLIGTFQQIASVAELFPTVLDSFNLSVTYPSEEFYRDSFPGEGTCHGTFVSTSSIAQGVVDSVVSKIAGNILKLPSTPRTRFDAWLRLRNKDWPRDKVFMDELLEKAVHDILDVSYFTNKLRTLLSTGIADPMTAPGIEFPCSRFNSPSHPVLKTGDGDISLQWTNELRVTPVSPGSVKATVFFMDPLNGSNVLQSQFQTEVLNHKPVVWTISPSTCKADASGACIVTVRLEDDDEMDIPVLKIAPPFSKYGAVNPSGITGGNNPEVKFSYAHNGKPGMEDLEFDVLLDTPKNFNIHSKTVFKTDTISSQVCDAYDCTGISIPVDLTGMPPIANGPITYHIIGDPEFGTINSSTEGYYTYTPNPGVHGEMDSLTYYVKVGDLVSATKKLEFEIKKPNTLPRPVNTDYFYLEKDQSSATVSFKVNDPDGVGSVFIQNLQALNGTVSASDIQFEDPASDEGTIDITYTFTGRLNVGNGAITLKPFTCKALQAVIFPPSEGYMFPDDDITFQLCDCEDREDCDEEERCVDVEIDFDEMNSTHNNNFNEVTIQVTQPPQYGRIEDFGNPYPYYCIEGWGGNETLPITASFKGSQPVTAQLQVTADQSCFYDWGYHTFEKRCLEEDGGRFTVNYVQEMDTAENGSLDGNGTFRISLQDAVTNEGVLQVIYSTRLNNHPELTSVKPDYVVDSIYENEDDKWTECIVFTPEVSSCDYSNNSGLAIGYWNRIDEEISRYCIDYEANPDWEIPISAWKTCGERLEESHIPSELAKPFPGKCEEWWGHTDDNGVSWACGWENDANCIYGKGSDGYYTKVCYDPVENDVTRYIQYKSSTTDYIEVVKQNSSRRPYSYPRNYNSYDLDEFIRYRTKLANGVSTAPAYVANKAGKRTCFVRERETADPNNQEMEQILVIGINDWEGPEEQIDQVIGAFPIGEAIPDTAYRQCADTLPSYLSNSVLNTFPGTCSNWWGYTDKDGFWQGCTE